MEFFGKKENENNGDSDNEEDDLNTKSDIIQKEVTNVEEVCDKFKEDGGVCFKDCSKSKIQSVCNMCKQMNDNLVMYELKRKYAQLKETIEK